MKKLTAFVFALVFALFAVAGVSALMVSNASAVDNPCDPPHGLLTWCKANHGRFDTSCCCCVLH